MRVKSNFFIGISILFLVFISWFIYDYFFAYVKSSFSKVVYRVIRKSNYITGDIDTCTDCNLHINIPYFSDYKKIPIKIYIDETLLIDEDLAQTNEHRLTDYNMGLGGPRYYYVGRLDKGNHEIKIIADEGTLVSSDTFEFKDKIYISIGLRYKEGEKRNRLENGEFIFEYYDKPLEFE